MEKSGACPPDGEMEAKKLTKLKVQTIVLQETKNNTSNRIGELRVRGDVISPPVGMPSATVNEINQVRSELTRSPFPSHLRSKLFPHVDW